MANYFAKYLYLWFLQYCPTLIILEFITNTLNIKFKCYCDHRQLYNKTTISPICIHKAMLNNRPNLETSPKKRRHRYHSKIIRLSTPADRTNKNRDKTTMDQLILMARPEAKKVRKNSHQLVLASQKVSIFQ